MGERANEKCLWGNSDVGLNRQNLEKATSKESEEQKEIMHKELHKSISKISLQTENINKQVIF